MKYISLFSGIGGLEHPDHAPVLLCERDPAARTVLGRLYPGVEIAHDITTLAKPPKADFVVGGWPCQDISAAGLQVGITGKKSSLFFEMVRVAKAAGAHTIIGENVTNLQTVNKGESWRAVLAALADAGYPHIAWRTLNAREFGLPQNRNRIFVCASKHPGFSRGIHAAMSDQSASAVSATGAFFWNGGKQSICYSRGFTPTIKVGCGEGHGGTVTIALHYAGVVRKISQSEVVSLQGYRSLPADGITRSHVLRMIGNAVCKPCGSFVVSSVMGEREPSGAPIAGSARVESGYVENGTVHGVRHEQGPLASNLDDFLDLASTDRLNPQASAGLIVRAARSGKPMPRELFDILLGYSQDRTQKMQPSRGNSFAYLDAMTAEIKEYRATKTTGGHS